MDESTSAALRQILEMNSMLADATAAMAEANFRIVSVLLGDSDGVEIVMPTMQ